MDSLHDVQSLHFHTPVLTETCLLSEASGSLSPSAGSTTTCVMYSFNVSDTQKKEKFKPSFQKSEHLSQNGIPGETASPTPDEQLLQETSASRRQVF